MLSAKFTSTSRKIKAFENPCGWERNRPASSSFNGAQTYFILKYPHKFYCQSLFFFFLLLKKKKVLNNPLTKFGQQSKQKMFPNFIRRQGFVKSQKQKVLKIKF